MNEQGGEYGNNGGGGPINRDYFDYGNGGGAPMYGFGYGGSGATTLTYRDVAGKGGFSYRQYSNGVVEIIGTPAEYKSAKGRSYQPNNTRDPKDPWTAITNEIGAFPGSSGAAAGSGSGGGAAGGGGTTEDKKKGGALVESASAFAVSLFDKLSGGGGSTAATVPAPYTAPAPAAASTSWVPWVVGGGIAFLLLGGLTYWAMKPPAREA